MRKAGKQERTGDSFPAFLIRISDKVFYPRRSRFYEPPVKKSHLACVQRINAPTILMSPAVCNRDADVALVGSLGVLALLRCRRA